MSTIKDFFVMTRNERRGTIVVLVLIALLLAGSVAVRSCRSSVPVIESQSNDLERFDAETDTVLLPSEPRQSKSHRDGSHRSSHRQSGKKSKPSNPASRPMDPVPQF